MLGCFEPPRTRCNGDGGCRECLVGGVGAGDGAPGLPGNGEAGPTGPGAQLRYGASGAGHPTFPGNAAWNPTLGRYWSHDYAERIVLDPDDSTVWLLTRHATFHRFTDLVAGVYTTASPADEKRELRRTAGGWELEELEGTVHSYDANGRWSQTTDRFGNTKMASFDGSGRLSSVEFPDGRLENFSYSATTGKLETIVEVGVDGTSTRTWTYTWSSLDLVRIDRPDGTALEFFYGDIRFPGYVTRVDLVGTSAGRRVIRGYEYNGTRQVVRTWRGATTFAAGVDRYAYTYSPLGRATTVTVTDPLGAVATSTYGYAADSDKPKLLTRSGDCPSCGLGASTQLTYGDAANPLLPTREVDGRGVITDWTYDDRGMPLSKTEAVSTALERTTTWSWDATYPGLITSQIVPSTSGGANERESATSYTPTRTTRTESGVESGSAFSLESIEDLNLAGRPLLIDPPGHGTADQTTFTYDPTRGDLVMLSRTDPSVGTTTFENDAFHRVIVTTDPNGVATETEFDDLDRVTRVTRLGGTAPENLVTESVHNEFGDLLRTLLPRGNVVEYGYDSAGRLTSVHRRPNAATNGERTTWTLDSAGNRTREDIERWNGSAWVLAARTSYDYSTRCRLDKVRVQKTPGQTASEVVTEYGYEPCTGDLSDLWDANHPRGTNPVAPTRYTYDALSRLAVLTQSWGGAGGGSVVTTYGYDVQDHLASVTDGEGSVTSYVYSDRDLMTSEVSPVSGTTTHAFDEHGQLVTTTDARGVTITRTVDAADRVTLVDYPGTELDTTYTYGSNPAAFNVGRLVSITRPNGTTVPYAYDRFGRVLTDGELSFTYDANGNRSTIGYPGGTVASYSYDFADRPTSLTATPAGGSAQSVASAASYLPSGPLSAVTLGNAVVETRSFDGRYVPTSIVASGNRLTWNYTTDNVGNPTAITQTQPAAESRTYGYQDHQYFLTTGNGPWGNLSWTYDRIGNRLTETRNGLSPDVYSYVLNSATPTPGNTALLDQITLGIGGNRNYGFGPAGHLDEIVSGAVTSDYQHSPEGQLTDIGTIGARSTMTYDGRGFLRQAEKPAFSIFEDSFETVDTSCWSDAVPSVTESRSTTGGPGCFTPGTPVTTTATYGSEGLLYSLLRSTGERHHVLHFNGRPVAQLRVPTAGAATFTYLTTDHLGTPILAMNQAGTTLWRGGFEPFGADWSGAGAAGVFLRFPGQWDDTTWAGVGPAGLSYNLFRWYERGTGRYERVDPGLQAIEYNSFLYGYSSPAVWIDRLGLLGDRAADVGGAVARTLVEDTRCIERIRDEIRAVADGKPRYQHCLGNCRITKECPTQQLGAAMASLFKEFSDVFRCLIQRRGNNCHSAFQGTDFDDNELGRRCPETRSCEEQCLPILRLVEPDGPPGPFAIFSPGAS
ncbi:MAG: hypothetical protein SF066_11940 [Thermoanaerobaculia bacterium]|nr:hypothetical protein [Thermoanaerobaculia bacterium]